MLKYGDEIWTFFGGYFKYAKRYLSFYRFRIDPVPSSGVSFRGHFKQWYKQPKTTQERRLSYKYEGYVRGKRMNHSLPNAYDDCHRGDVYDKRSWKKIKLKKQWMKHEKNC